MAKILTSILITLLISNASYSSSVLKTGISKNTHFTFSEIESLAKNKKLTPALEKKLKLILNNNYTGQTPYPAKKYLLRDEQTGRKTFRITHWNLERGYKLNELNQALNNTNTYIKLNDNDPKNALDKEALKEEIARFKETDIFTLNEADYGMHRTNYENTIREFAKIVKAKYFLFNTEYVELDPKYLNSPKLQKHKYKGLHGNAIVSKFPIVSSRVINLPQCYDWYEGELKNLSWLEKLKRATSRKIFKAPIVTELRRGDRSAIVTKIDVPNSLQHYTVVTTHFENRTRPKCRKIQLKYLLEEIKDIDTPLVLTGDLNNSEISAEPTSFVSVAKRTLTDWQNLGRVTATWFNPLSFIINPSMLAINTIRKAHDPTVLGLPIFLRNKTADLFWKVINFEFTDGNMFDFSDDKKLSYKGKDGKLSNSNQRVNKGFASTFRLSNKNIFTHFRFDWIFAKSMRIPGCQDNEDDFEDIKPECKHFIPAYGRNLRVLNESHNKKYPQEVVENIYRDFDITRLSDHEPITCKILI